MKLACQEMEENEARTSERRQDPGREEPSRKNRALFSPTRQRLCARAYGGMSPAVLRAKIRYSSYLGLTYLILRARSVRTNGE
jgi:hypothetical protein